jgi:hypothetical protein
VSSMATFRASKLHETRTYGCCRKRPGVVRGRWRHCRTIRQNRPMTYRRIIGQLAIPAAFAALSWMEKLLRSPMVRSTMRCFAMDR